MNNEYSFRPMYIGVIPVTLTRALRLAQVNTDTYIDFAKLCDIVSPKDVKFYYELNKALQTEAKFTLGMTNIVDHPLNQSWVSQKQEGYTPGSSPYNMTDDAVSVGYIQSVYVPLDTVLIELDTSNNDTSIPAAEMRAKYRTLLHDTLTVMSTLATLTAIQTTELYREFVRLS